VRAIITNQPTSEVKVIERLRDQTVFHLVDGHSLRVGEPSEKLQAQLDRIKEISGIDLSKPPSTQPDIFYYPFMTREVYDRTWPVVGSHSKVQNAFRGHPKLQAVAALSYEQLRDLPLEAYISGPFGLYLSHPFNFMSRAPDRELPDAENEYRCDFRDGEHLVKVYINVRTQAVAVKKDSL
jgi:hypothetical protein